MNLEKAKNLLCKGRTVIILLVVYFIFRNIGNFYVVPQFINYSGGPSILDATIHYSPEYADNLLCKIGAEGREFYKNEILIFDFVFPCVVFMFFSSFYLFLLKKIESSFDIVLLIPLIALVTDFTENILILITIAGFPDTNPVIIRTASVFTIMKSIAALMIIAVIPVLLVTLLVKKIRKKN